MFEKCAGGIWGVSAVQDADVGLRFGSVEEQD